MSTFYVIDRSAGAELNSAEVLRAFSTRKAAREFIRRETRELYLASDRPINASPDTGYGGVMEIVELRERYLPVPVVSVRIDLRAQPLEGGK